VACGPAVLVAPGIRGIPEGLVLSGASDVLWFPTNLWLPSDPWVPGFPGPRASLGTSSRPPGVYTVEGSSTCDLAERVPAPRPLPPCGAPTGGRPCPRDAAAGSRRLAGFLRVPGSVDTRDRLDSPLRVKAKTDSTTRPNAMPATPTSSPRLVIAPGGCLVACRMAMPTITRMTPSMTVTAPTTDRVMTSRTLLAVAVLERTAQRSHRGYRPASHMARCNHYGFPSGASPRVLKINIRHVLPLTSPTRHFVLTRANWVPLRGLPGDTLCT
jgi:hypothetical protein